MPSLSTAWSAIAKRAAADWLILSAALITIVLATVLLAAGPIYVEAVTVASLHRTLDHASAIDANVEVSLRVRPAAYSEKNQLVTDEVLRTFASTGAALIRRLASDSYEFPEQASNGATDVGLFRYYEGVSEHATVVDGAWPAPGGEPHQTAVSQSTATLLGLSVGDELAMINRRDRSISARVMIAGIYRIDDPNDPYWYADELDLNGVQERSSFRTFGPFLVDPQTMLTDLAPFSVEADWRVFPDYDNLSVGDIREMRGRVQGLETRLNAAASAQFEAFTVETQVSRILSETERSLLVTRSGVLLLSAQLAVLAGYALLLTAGLLAESRRVETNLLRSRGANTRQVVTMAIMEGALLTVPVALVAPWLALLVLNVFNDIGPLASIELAIEPAVTRSAYLLSFLACAGCVAALAIPARRSARSFSVEYVERGRQPTDSLWQRTGVDLALLATAGLAFWQLDRYGSQITSTVEGRLGIDPLLVLAPALGLLAGAVLALRSIPLMAWMAERTATAGTSAVPALSAWQVARRPNRYARSALLLIVALSIGIFAAAYTTTWTQSQDDQADFQVGSDIRVTPNRHPANRIPDLTLQDAYQQVAGVQASMPIAREVRQLARSSGNGAFVMLDANQAASVVRIRHDLSTSPFSDLMTELASARPQLSTLPLPGRPQRIALDVATELEPLPVDSVIPDEVLERPFSFAPSVAVVLQDGEGMLHEVELGSPPADGGRARLVSDLAHMGSDGRVAEPTYPLAIVDITFTSPAPHLIARVATFELAGISVSPDLFTDSWRPATSTWKPEVWELTSTPLSGAVTPPTISPTPSQPETGIGLTITTGAGTAPVPLPVHFSLRPAGTTLPERFPIVVSEGFLELTGAAVGDDVSLTTLRAPGGSARVVGTVVNFPTVDPQSGEVILIDFPTFQMMRYQPGSEIRQPDERWIDAAGDKIAVVAEELAGPRFDSTLLEDRIDRADALKSDPVALGMVGALSLGFVAAAIFAAVGFSVSSVVSARERLGEFGLLRALGLSPRQLAGWLSIDHGVLVAVSLIMGTLVGWLLAWLILPLISITQEATTAIPEVVVVYPWQAIAWLELALVLVLGAIVIVLAILVRRLGLASLLRLGND
ncbi:MAG: ABC transporter permease [Acidimicrobiia bacterium]|nr:ABC transporter permease [Acidimicrobiia bacterium]